MYKFLPLLFLLAFTPASFSQNPAIAGDARGITCLHPADRWENGFMTGNGTLGAIVFGNPASETIIGNDARLFLPLQTTRNPAMVWKGAKEWEVGLLVARRFVPEIASLLPEVREIIRKEGSPAGYITAQNRVWEEAKKQGFMGYQCPGNYHAGFKLLLEMPVAGAVRDYQRSTNFENGEIRVRWTDDQGGVERRLFSSRPAEVMVGSIRRAEGKVGAAFHWGGFKDMRLARMNSTADADGWLISQVTYDCGKEENKGGYLAAIRIVPRGGTISSTSDTVSVQDADEILVFMKIQPFAFGVDPPVRQVKEALTALPLDYGKLLAAHQAVHGPMFLRCALDLGGGADRALPVETLLAQGQKSGSYPPALFEKLYDVCRYAVLSSSGVYPPGGKGIWIGQWQDRWNTNYTLDTNLQLETASILSANLPELMEPLANFFMNEPVMTDFRTNAKKIFGARGIQIPQTRWPDCGLNVAWGPRVSCSEYWTAGAAWFASIFYDYYLYTGDRDFLRNRLVPFMKEAALFYEDFLITDETGRFRFTPGWSPENGVLAGAGDNPTMDIAACKELLTNLIAACETLGIEQANLPRWRAMLGKLPPYVINADGALAEWAWPGSKDNYAHRHLSHLYPLWRSREITPAQPELFKAARVAADRRIGAGGEDGSTHGLAFLAITGNALGDGNLAYAQLQRMLVNDYYCDSLMTAHFAKRKVFWIDGTGAWSEIVNGMIISSSPGNLDLLPALPDALPKGELRGILARGQIRIDRITWDQPAGKLRVELTSAIEQRLTLRLPQARAITEIQATGATLHPSPQGANARTLALLGGKQVQLEILFTAGER